jgi:hypothetical protein
MLWIASAGADAAPERLQVLLSSFRVLSFDAAIAYLCFLITRSVGKKHPRIESAISTGVYVMPLMPFAQGIVCAIFFPQPALDTYAPGTAELLVPRVRSLAEAFYLSLLTLVFLTEALSQPNRRLRAQNLLLSFAGLSLMIPIFCNFFTSGLRAFYAGPYLDVLLGRAHAVLLVSALLASVFYLSGVVLYHSAEEREALLARYRNWVRLRYDLEVAFEGYFRTLLGESGGGKKLTAYLQRASDHLGLSDRQQEQAWLTVGLLALIRVSGRRARLISELLDAQRQVLHDRALADRSLARIGGGLRYDIRDDPLHLALSAALLIAHDGHPEPPRENRGTRADWVQLAAAVAADVGFLPPPKSRQILGNASSLATPRVVQAYRAATRGTPQSHQSTYGRTGPRTS